MRGSGSIILIGIAAVLIVIAATDRAKDVWAAITGATGLAPNDASANNGTDTGNTTNHPTDNPDDQNACEGLVFIPEAGDNSKYCCPTEEVGSRNQDGTCPRQYVAGQSSDGSGFIETCARLTACKGIKGAGGYGAQVRRHVIYHQTGKASIVRAF